MDNLQVFLAVATGLGLAAACGFRVFVPMLVASIAARTGAFDVASGFEWLGSTPALVGFASATALEIAGYYVPWVDHLLDAVATPAAAVAGTLLAAAAFVDLDTPLGPWLGWSLAIIAGGGLATAVQTATVAVRGASTLTTGGLANPLVATGELAGSSAASVLAVVAPVLLFVLFAGAAFWILRRRTAAARCRI